MKAINRYLIGAILGLGLFVGPSFGQVGNDSPTGPAGEFEGSGVSTTGGHISTYTANATRTVTDLVVSGGVGAYPLAFTRTSNSRSYLTQDNSIGGAAQNADFGTGGNWLHSYQWAITCKWPNAGGKPTKYTVSYPDGAGAIFSPPSCGGGGGGGGTCDPYYRGGQGVSDRLQLVWDSSTVGRAYLLRPDGGKIWFSVSKTAGNSVQGIIDPYGQTTTIVGSVQTGLVTITEPGGRWIKVHYIDHGSWVSTIDYILASDGRRVDYSYTHDQSNQHWHLVQVTYYSDPNLKSTYTYQADNSNSGGNDLLSTAIDPMYAGPMWKIAYTYQTATNPDGTLPVYGQIRSENYFDGTNAGAAVTTLTVQNSTTRIEIRADGKTRTFTYNATPLLTSWTDFKGNTASQTYDANGFINAVTDYNGHTTNFTNNAFTGARLTTTFPSTLVDTPPNTPRGVVSITYGSASCADPNNKDPNNPYYVCTATDESGHTTTYTRDTSKRVTQVNYPDGGSESFQYNPFGQPTSHTLLTGGAETNEFDSRGLLQKYRDPYHATGNPNVWFSYDGFDRVVGVTDALGTSNTDWNHTTSYSYNSRGDITTATLPIDPNDGQRHTVTRVINLANGTVTSVTDQLGHTTSFTYDDYKRLRTTTTPPRSTGDSLNHTASVYYDANGSGEDYTRTDANITWAVLPSGKKANTLYDENRRKISITVAPGTSDAATTSFGYDLNGNLTSVIAPKEQPGQQFAGQSTITTYDERNRPYLVTDPLGNVTSCTYDAAGRKKTVTRANGQVTTFDSFDAMNRLLQLTVKQTPEPDAVTKYTYYASGLLATMKDPRLVATNSSDSYSYQYDLMGRKTSLTYPPASASTSESWHYDTAGRVDTFTNRNGNTQRTLYDSLNRPYNVAWDDSGLTPTVTLAYDAASRVTAINNANANISHAFYNDGLLSSETTTYADNVARAVSYAYDADADRASIQYPNNAYFFTYGYTERNQTSRVSGSNNGVNCTFDVDGNIQSRLISGTPASGYSYDGVGRVTHIAHSFVTAGTRTFDYAYDSVGNRKWVKRDGGSGDVFGYDLADQSTSVLLNVPNPDTVSTGPQTINYDANGNRTSFSPYGTSDTYTTNNLNQYTQRNASTAGYDTKGNMTTGFDNSTYTFDAQNRILAASKGGTTDTFKYDALNRQVSRQIGSNPVVYNIYDGWNLIAEYAAGSALPSNAYLYGPDGLAQNVVTGVCYYHDGSGSTSHLADNSGHLVEWYRYDLQGTPFFYNASNSQIPSSYNGVRHLFTGQQWYSELGLYDLRNRFYSPDIGRFLQGDPIGFGGDATNLYRYAGNNSPNRTDPYGLLYGDLTTQEYRDVANDIFASPLTPYVLGAGAVGIAFVTAPEWVPPAVAVGLSSPMGRYYSTHGAEEFERLDAITDAISRWFESLGPTTGCEPPRVSPDFDVKVGEPVPTAPPPPCNYHAGYFGISDIASTRWAGPSWLGGLANLLGSSNVNAVGHVYSIGVAFALDPANALPFLSGRESGIGMGAAVGESNGSGDGGDGGGPRMTWVQAGTGTPAPTQYATAYKWHAYPTSMVINSGGVKGYWQPIAWSTDPSAYVAPPTTTPRGRPIGMVHYPRGHGHR